MAGWSWLASFRLRLLFRGAFLLLVFAVLAMTVALLRDEKQRSHDHYLDSADKTMEQILARLRHPAGQLALLNPGRTSQATPGQPVMLPFAALDFDDRNKVRNAIDLSGCLLRYGDDASLCVAIGNTPWSGAYVYAAGAFASPALVAHTLGDEEFDQSHRLQVTLQARGSTVRWVAPYEQATAQGPGGTQGRFTGYLEKTGGNYKGERPLREFRGWVWQETGCLDGKDDAACRRKAFFSLRLPVEALREALFQSARPVWPPQDLDQFHLRIQLLAPDSAEVLFDSEQAGASPPFVLGDLQALLAPGERLSVTRDGKPVALLSGREDKLQASLLLNRLIGWLPIEQHVAPVHLANTVTTPTGVYRIAFDGDARSVNRSLGLVASRVSWLVGAMLTAIGLAWLAIEIFLIRPIARLTKRTRGLSGTVRAEAGLERFALQDLRGKDEMGLLAGALDDLVRRVQDDAQRERIRAEQEKDMWHAVGHEIVSPLQSLLVLHGRSDDPSHRYIQRMQQAVRILYGSASPSEAFTASNLSLDTLDLHEFLQHVAENAGVTDLVLDAADAAVPVKADAYSLEDVLAHLLKNAERHRTPGTAITLRLRSSDSAAVVTVHNQGPPIAADMQGKIFEYGVTGQAEPGAGNRGQGLFVVKTYMAKMGGTVAVANVDGGVAFTLELPRAPSAGA